MQATPQTPRRMLYILLGLALIIGVALLLLFPYVSTATAQTRTIRIPRNATRQNVEDSLSKYYDPAFASRVMKVASLRTSDFASRHGAYEIESGSNAMSVARRLTGGAQTPVTLTINGFRNFDLLLDRISRKFEFSADSLRKVVTDPDVLSRYGLTPQQAMALFVDDSYSLYWSASPEEAVKKIGDNYLNLWNPERTSKAAALCLTPADVMILASIVDEETNAASEKGAVGRLYINRLQKGMKLQSDPTVRFAVGDFTIRRVKGEHLKVQSPYNTYIHKGLPPGPIRTVPKATVDSILNSTPHPYLYMCAKEDFSGTHNFAVTYDEHLVNARRYQEELNRRGIQ